MCFCHNRRILLKKHCLDPPLKKLYFNFKKVRLLTAIINANVNTDSLPISISLSITLLSFSVFSIVTCAATAMVAWNRFLKRRPRVSIFVIAWFFFVTDSKMPDPVEAKLTSFYEQLHDSIVYSFLSTPAGRLLFNYFERRRQPHGWTGGWCSRVRNAWNGDLFSLFFPLSLLFWLLWDWALLCYSSILLKCAGKETILARATR